MTSQRVLELWRRIRSGLMLTIDKFAPEELNFRPFEGAYSVGEIILHIAHEEEIELLYGLVRRRGALSPAPALPEKATPASLKAVLEAIHRETELVLGSLDDRQFAEDVGLAWGGTQRRDAVVLHVLEHKIHHRGELSLILGLLGRPSLDA